jgi:hypothetical protein
MASFWIMFQVAILSITTRHRSRAVVPRHNRDIPKGTLFSLLREGGFTRDELLNFLQIG